MDEEQRKYGEQFETGTIFLMITLIVLSFVGVLSLQPRNECTAGDYTYCGSAQPHH